MAVVCCPVCGENVNNRPEIKCSVCETPHHAECWGYNGGCARYGCKKSLVIREQSPVAPNLTAFSKLEYYVKKRIIVKIKRGLAGLWKILTYPIQFPENIIGKFFVSTFYSPKAQADYVKKHNYDPNSFWIENFGVSVVLLMIGIVIEICGHLIFNFSESASIFPLIFIYFFLQLCSKAYSENYPHEYNKYAPVWFAFEYLLEYLHKKIKSFVLEIPIFVNNFINGILEQGEICAIEEHQEQINQHKNGV